MSALGRFLKPLALLVLGSSAHAAESPFDLVGVRLGMTPDEAMTAAKAWSPQDKWRTLPVQLSFLDDREREVRIPNTTTAGTISNDGTNSLLVLFTTTPGRERVAGIRRAQSFLKERPLRNDLVAGLEKKFGRPAAIESTTLLWTFGPDGKPRKPAANSYGEPCASPFPGGSYKPVSHPYVVEGRKKITSRLVDTCGTVVVTARLSADQQGFVDRMLVDMIGHAIATAGYEETSRIIAAAQSIHMNKVKAEGAKLAKPDL